MQQLCASCPLLFRPHATGYAFLAMPFVNWQHVNAIYCGVLWTVALVLAVVILIQCLPQGTTPRPHRAPVMVVTR
jgi:hypothetical protein